jgi:hypothetical protein
MEMCVNFIDLNKTFPNDNFSLPKIDLLVESTVGNELVNFMDAFLGYNQMQIYWPDQEKTYFIIDQGLYYYRVMPFSLKNAKATY